MTSATFLYGKLTTIERHILEQQHLHPDATGALTYILCDLALAGKLIASKMIEAGLMDILGEAGEENVQGEKVMKLDKFADYTIRRLNDRTGRVGAMASEENADPLPIAHPFSTGKYVLLYDPLDGSSNIDYDVSVGTIFAVYKRKSAKGPGTLDDCLQPGRNLVAAGYVIYGSSTMFVYTTGHGVHGFTLKRNVGEFLLSHPNIRIPKEPKYYSANHGYERYWGPAVQKLTRYFKGDDEGGLNLSQRYIGSLVADFHRNLLTGGIYYYPADRKDPKKPEGKLRLLYEANPLAFIAEQAGGYASDGATRILDLEPTSLHQRVPLYIGSRPLVEKAEEYLRKYDDKA